MASKKLKARRKRMRKVFITLLVLFALAAAFVRLIVFEPVRIGSDAMEPAYSKGDVVCMLKGAVVTQADVARGDVVLARFTGSDSSVAVRRVAGVAGDRIEDRGGQKYLVYADADGVAREKALGEAPALANGTLPDGAYLLLADQSSAEAYDSRTCGLVIFKNITAKAGAILWPPSRMFR